MSTLYRQYRPQKFADIFGQPHIVQTLSAAITKDRISHAFLFQGPRGTGKTSTARILAKRLNCQSPNEAEPCGTCTMCVATQEGKNIDIIEIDAASNRGIDNIRSLRENTALSPVQGKYKVYIIDEVHMLSHDAFPALLKTLEEPVAHVVFILATTELHKVPPTVLSRCQVYRFRRATDQEMRERLHYILKAEKRETDAAVVDFIISRADGCYRDAESLLGQLLSVQDTTLTGEHLPSLLGLPSPTLVADFLGALVAGNLPAALTHIDTIYTSGIDPEQFLQECVRTARDTIVQVTTSSGQVPEYARQAGAVPKLTNAIRAFIQAIADLAYVPQPHIALQLAAMTLCATARPQAAQQPAPAPSAAATFTPVKKQISPTAATAVSLTPSVPVETKPATTGIVTVEAVMAIWPKLILQIKQNNPVASTFLRAVEPLRVDGSVVALRVSYPLHRTFFEKAQNKAMVEKILQELLQVTITIMCEMETAPTAAAPRSMPSAAKPTFSAPRPSAKPAAQNDTVYQAVKEVFGAGN